jgi:hypothetical protein
VGWTWLQPKTYESLVAVLGTPTLFRDYVLITRDHFEAAVAAAEYKETEAAEAPLVPVTPLDKARCESLRRVARLCCGLAPGDGP